MLRLSELRESLRHLEKVTSANFGWNSILLIAFSYYKQQILRSANEFAILKLYLESMSRYVSSRETLFT